MKGVVEQHTRHREHVQRPCGTEDHHGMIEELSTRTHLSRHPQVVSLCGVVRAPSEYGEWIPREPEASVLHFYNLASEDT